KAVLGDFFQRSAAQPSAYQATSESPLPGASAREVESSYLTLPEAKAASGDIRRQAPGVFSGSKEGELWMPERDVTRVPHNLLAREIAEVRSPLFAFEPLEGFSRQIFKVTANRQGDLAVKADEITTARKHYVGTVEQVKGRIVSKGILSIEELHISKFARQQLAERPDLLKTYEAYVSAREAHASKVSELEQAVEARARDLQKTVNTMTDHFGLAPVRVKAFEDLRGSGAAYGPGSGEVRLRNEDLYNRSDTAGLVSRILHELGHSVQDTLGIRHLADTYGVGKQATAGQLD